MSFDNPKLILIKLAVNLSYNL